MGRLFFGGGYDFDIDDSMFPDEYKDNTPEKPKETKNLETKKSSDTQPEKNKETETKAPRRSERLRLKLNSK